MIKVINPCEAWALKYDTWLWVWGCKQSCVAVGCPSINMLWWKSLIISLQKVNKICVFLYLETHALWLPFQCGLLCLIFCFYGVIISLVTACSTHVCVRWLCVWGAFYFQTSVSTEAKIIVVINYIVIWYINNYSVIFWSENKIYWNIALIDLWK